MAKRRARFVIEVDIVDLDDETRSELEMDQIDQEYPTTLPNLTDYLEEGEIEKQVGWLVAGWLEPELVGEMFAGSDLYVTMQEGHLVTAEWVGELRD